MRYEKIEEEASFRELAMADDKREQCEFIIVEGELVAIRVGQTRIAATKGVGLTVYREIET